MVGKLPHDKAKRCRITTLQTHEAHSGKDKKRNISTRLIVKAMHGNGDRRHERE